MCFVQFDVFCSIVLCVVLQGDLVETKRKTVSAIDDNSGYQDTELKLKETQLEQVMRVTSKQQSDNLTNNESMLSDVINGAKYNGKNEHTLLPFPGLLVYSFLFIFLDTAIVAITN